ncbi:UNVERIFIED_ORG: type VII secretion-associated serine protease mycosin [Actinomadura viridilutea]|nr:S8 family serine peptidase [Actinomadura rubrobrunea]
MRWTAVTVLAGWLATMLPTTAAHAAPAASAPQCRPERGSLTRQQIVQEPWAQQILNIRAAHEKATGRGVRVAVIDSGVTAENPQLAGRVLPGVDLTKTTPRDCVGHGTWVAGIIAAKRGVSPFYGVAPDAQIIPIKFANQAANIDSGLAAKGIEAAIKLKADVINVSTQSISDDPRLRAAVQRALAAGIVVVAAAGNVDPKNGGTPEPMYPGGYPGVISVGAVDQSGQITQFSNPNTPVSVIAPGKDIVTTAPDGTYAVKDGTSFATPIVAGVAALIKEAHPDLTPAQIKQRIEQTAEGSKGPGSGAGMVNPYEAVTAVISGGAPSGGTGPAAGAVAPVKIVMPEKPDPLTRNLALSIAGGALALSGIVVAGGMLIPLGRRRRWRPGRAVTTPGDGDGAGRRFR